MITVVIGFICAMNLSYRIGKRVYPDFEWSVSTEEQRVYITFDDGPHPSITPWVLDLLREKNARATFFVVGSNAQEYPDVIQRIVDEGHSLGNHTQSHLKGWSVSTEDYLEDIRACEASIPKTNLFRPPYGRINKGSIPSLRDYRIIMWDNLSRDYVQGLNKSFSLKSLKTNTKSGSIAVFHDSEKAEENMKFLLPRYIDYLIEQGYQLMAL